MDIIKSFMLENGLFRGAYIAADNTINQCWNNHNYPDELKQLFSQAVLVTIALASGIKYEGVFSLQIKGTGPISSLFVDITNDKKVRGYIVYDESKKYNAGMTLPELFGRGQLIFSVAGLGHEPYQGIVALNHEKLADVIKDYFQMSEQIDTEIIIRNNDHGSRCLLLQKMPDKTDMHSEEQNNLWETVCILMNSVQNDELFSEKLTPDDVLFRLFHANQLTLFEAKIPMFGCRCYRGKMENFLKKMTMAERISLYNDKGEIDIVCQFCGEKYTFTKADLGDK